MENNEYDTGSDVGYDDYESDFDSGFESDDGGVPDTVESELDAVADLLSGNSEKADALAAQREKTGARSKVARQAINLDSHGHKIWHQSSEPAPEPKAEQSETIYARQVSDQRSYAQSEWDAAHAENERLNDLFSSGQMSAEEHYQLTLAQGQRAAAAKEMMYQTTIAEMMHERQLDDTHRKLESTLGDAWSPENRNETMRDMINWARGQGLSDDLLAGVENEHEALAIYNAMQNERELQATRLELKAARAMLKKQNQQLKGRQRKMAKDNNIGQRNASAIDQVAQLLSDHGIRGGR